MRSDGFQPWVQIRYHNSTHLIVGALMLDHTDGVDVFSNSLLLQLYLKHQKGKKFVTSK